jgi:transcription elongation factor GreA
MDKVPMTSHGYDKLMAELKQIKNVERPRIITAIEEARAHGDLSENAEYHAAKEQQGLNEARIAELEAKLSRAQVIDPAKLSGDKIVLGATVTLEDMDSGKEITYVLVGADEADLDNGLISVTSPIGRALLGKSEGDEAIVKAPSGNREYEVIAVKFQAIAA